MRSYSHLSEDERDQIGVLRAAGRSMGAIARALGRAKTTISRELQRNALPSGGYSPLHAAGAYQLRTHKTERPGFATLTAAAHAYRGRPKTGFFNEIRRLPPFDAWGPALDRRARIRAS